jgi:hypothetical protein
MNATTARTLQPGQTYDPGYDVPALEVGKTKIAGRTVIAAIRQTDGPGLLPGLHVVTAWSETEYQPYATWEVAWMAYPATGMAEDAPKGRWVANAGHYMDDVRAALTDMTARAWGWTSPVSTKEA